MKILFLVPALLLFSPALHAVGFDCAKASTAMEKAVCGNKELSIKDDELTLAYATAINGLSDEAKKVMKNNQHAWLAYLRKTCAAEPYCMINSYTQRISVLQNSKTIGGLRFYTKDVYIALPDKDNYSNNNPWGIHEGSYVQIDGDNELAKAFNATVAKEADSGEGKEATNDTTHTISVKEITDKRISLEINTSYYGHGAAHGIGGLMYIHFLRGKLRELETKDLFVENWEETFNQLVGKALKTALEREPDAGSSYTTAPTRWTFEKNGFGVHFEPYEVASYAEGMPLAVIPWNDIKPILLPDAMELIAPANH